MSRVVRSADIATPPVWCGTQEDIHLCRCTPLYTLSTSVSVLPRAEDVHRGQAVAYAGDAVVISVVDVALKLGVDRGGHTPSRGRTFSISLPFFFYSFHFF